MKTTRLLALGITFVLAACSGAGGGGTPTPPGVTGGPHGMAAVDFTIVIPQNAVTATSRVRPTYISSNTQSLAMSVNGGASQVFALTPSTNSNCSTTSGTTTCTNLQAVAPVGTDNFVFTLYASTNGSGSALSVAAVNNKVVQEGVANQLGQFTLNPVIGSIGLGIPGSFTAGTSSSGNAINITAKDPSGATIIAPGSYVDSSDTTTPIALTSTATSFTFSVDAAAAAATGSLSGPSDSATLAFNGSVGSSTIKAASGSINATQVINPTAQPIVLGLSSSASAADYSITTSPAELDFYTSGITGTVTPSEAGYSGTYSLSSSTCTSSEVSFSPTVGNSASSFTVSAVAAGTTASPAICTATFEDTNGETATATFSVTTISFGLQ